MIKRQDEWSERLSALVLLLASVAVAVVSRDAVVDCRGTIEQRERQLDALETWSRGAVADRSAALPDLTGLFGVASEVVVVSWPGGKHLELRGCVSRP